MAQELTLTVPLEFVLPTTLHTTPETTATILKLGCIAYETILHEGQTLSHDALLATLKEEASRDYVPVVESLKQKLSQGETLAQTLRTRLQGLEEEVRAIEKRIREEERRNREEILAEKQSRIQELEKRLRETLASVESTVRTSNQSLVDGFQTFKEQILKGTVGSSTRGKMGERQFSDLLRAAYGAVSVGEEFDVECVGAEGHQGDIHMRWKGHLIMWEVKNYTRTIEKKEVLKFLRDMEENPQMSMGIMVGLHTGIAAHTHAGGFDIEELRDGRVCIYITQFSSHEDTLAVLQGLQPFMETFLRRQTVTLRDTQKRDHESVDALELRIGQIEANRAVLQRLMEHHVDVMRKYKNSVMNAKKKSDAIWADVLAGIKDAEHGVKLLLDTLLHDTESAEQSEEYEDGLPSRQEKGREKGRTKISKDRVLPAYVFRHVDWSMYNDKEQHFLYETLKLFEFDEDYRASTRDVKDAYKTCGFSEDVVNTLRSSIFLDAAWERGKKEVKGVRVKA